MKQGKKSRVLDIAERLFNRFGIRRTGVDEIAQMADVAKGTIYNYFGDKEGLFRALVQRKFVSFEAKIEQSVSSVKDPIEKIKLVVSTHLSTIIETPYLSDKLLYASYEEKIRQLLLELEQRSKSALNRIMEREFGKRAPLGERMVIVNALVLAIKGMDESVRSRLDSVSPKIFEAEIDCLVNAMVSRLKVPGKSVVDG